MAMTVRRVLPMRRHTVFCGEHVLPLKWSTPTFVVRCLGKRRACAQVRRSLCPMPRA